MMKNKEDLKWCLSIMLKRQFYIDRWIGDSEMLMWQDSGQSISIDRHWKHDDRLKLMYDDCDNFGKKNK